MAKPHPKHVRWIMCFTIALALAAGVASAAEEPRYGGTFVAAMGGNPDHLNPTLTTNVYVHSPASVLYNNLVELDKDDNLRADLARSWAISDDGKTYTFKLYPGVRWHDGKPFTSADVKYTFEEVLKKYHGRGRVVLSALDRVETPDPLTVVFKLKYPYLPFLTFVGANDARILPKHLYEGTDPRKNPYNLKPVATGAFKFVEWKRGSHIVFERNRDYFKKGQPYLDKVIFKVIPNTSARIIALESGEADYVAYYNLPSSEVGRLKKVSNVVVTKEGHSASSSVMPLVLNLDRPIFKNRKVRWALAHAIDKNFILQKADYSLGKVATGPISSETAWFYNGNVRRFEYDRKKAEQLLDEAGYKRGPDGVRFRVGVIANRGLDLFTKTAEIIAEQLKQVGIEVKVQILDRTTMLTAIFQKRNFDMWVHGFATGPDPDLSVARLYVSSNIRPAPFTNGAGYRNQEVDELFAKAGRAASREERARLYRKMQETIVEDQPYVWLLEYGLNSAFKAEFSGLHTWAPAGYYQLDEVWWKKGRPRP